MEKQLPSRCRFVEPQSFRKALFLLYVLTLWPSTLSVRIDESNRTEHFLARVKAFRANDGLEVQPNRFQSIGTNLALHVISLTSPRLHVFLLALTRPQSFPVHVLGRHGARTTSEHKSHCHYSVVPVGASSGQVSEAIDHHDLAVVSLCKGFVHGVLPINASHFGHIQPTGPASSDGSEPSWQLYQVSLYPLRASRVQLDRLEANYAELNRRFSAASNVQLHHFFGESELQRRRRSAPTEMRNIRLDLSRPVLTSKGPYLFQLYIIADYGFYKQSGSRESDVVDAAQSIISIVNNMYRQFDVYVIVAALEIHTRPVSGYDFSKPKNEEFSKTLSLLKNYSMRIASEYDCLHLLHGRDKYYHRLTAGLASVGTICTRPHCASFTVSVVRHSKGPHKITGLVMAHELAHNLGVEHDGEYLGKDCACPASNCVMGSIDNKEIPWSKCSVAALRGFLDSRFRHCLTSPRPEADSWGGLQLPVAANWPAATCGNGILEPGEACDCGGEDGCRGGNDCCDPVACQLAAKSTCAAGRCCDLAACRPRPAGAVCRPARDVCDLPEYCDGVRPDCPPDVTARDGTRCGFNFCAGGVCSSAMAQCQMMWGPAAQAAGRCLYRNESQCGDLWCVHTRGRNPSGPGSSCLKATRGAGCVSVSCNYSSQSLRSPGQVPDGARCGGDGGGGVPTGSGERMCLKGKCLSALDVRNQTGGSRGGACHNGTVNSRGNCHCPPGFAPPDCLAPGNGGSVDSGPLQSVDSGPLQSVDSREHGGLRPLTVAAIALGCIIAVAGAAAAAYFAFAGWHQLPRLPCLRSGCRGRPRPPPPPPPKQPQQVLPWSPIAAAPPAIVRATSEFPSTATQPPTSKAFTPKPQTPILNPSTQKPPKPNPSTSKPVSSTPSTSKMQTTNFLAAQLQAPRPPTPKLPPAAPKSKPTPKPAKAAGAAQPLSVHALVQQFASSSGGSSGGGGGSSSSKHGARPIPDVLGKPRV